LGDKRFWLVSYEEFCRDPGALVRRIAREILGDENFVVGTPPASFAVSTGDRVPREVAARIDAELALAACS
jgi:hypothetical protein